MRKFNFCIKFCASIKRTNLSESHFFFLFLTVTSFKLSYFYYATMQRKNSSINDQISVYNISYVIIMNAIIRKEGNELKELNEILN